MIGLTLLAINITGEYIPMLKSPRYGYGRNMNPCIDCHTLMLNIAGKKMEEIEADFCLPAKSWDSAPCHRTNKLFI
jgi:Predicted tRNA(5-methylaminomethyl-2-thiouridylate) methyltransferase, contains the PP-loop ATPase domain